MNWPAGTGQVPVLSPSASRLKRRVGLVAIGESDSRAEHRDAVDLQEKLGSGQTGDDQQRIGRRMRRVQILAADLAELRNIVYVGDVGRGLYQVSQRATHAGERAPEVLVHLFRLGLEVALAHDLPRTVERHLTRQIHRPS